MWWRLTLFFFNLLSFVLAWGVVKAWTPLTLVGVTNLGSFFSGTPGRGAAEKEVRPGSWEDKRLTIPDEELDVLNPKPKPKYWVQSSKLSKPSTYRRVTGQLDAPVDVGKLRYFCDGELRARPQRVHLNHLGLGGRSYV